MALLEAEEGAFLSFAGRSLVPTFLAFASALRSERVSEASSSPSSLSLLFPSVAQLNLDFCPFNKPIFRLPLYAAAAPTDEDESSSSTRACAVSMQKPPVVIPSSLPPVPPVPPPIYMLQPPFAFVVS